MTPSDLLFWPWQRILCGIAGAAFAGKIVCDMRRGWTHGAEGTIIRRADRPFVYGTMLIIEALAALFCLSVAADWLPPSSEPSLI